MRLATTVFASLVLLAGAVSAQENPIADGLALWMRPDIGVTTDASGGVELWADQSGRGHFFVQSLEARRPLLVEDGIGGVPVLRFDGSDDFLTGGDILDDVLSGEDKVFTFIVVINSEVEDNGLIVGKYSPSDNQRQMILRLFQNRPEMTVYFSTGFDRFRSGIGLLDASGQPRVVTFMYDGVEDGSDGGDRFGQFLNGSVNPVSVSDQAGVLGDIVDSSAHVGIGAGANTAGTGSHSARFDGDIAEILLYDRLLTDDERRQVEVYLGTKYGLDVVGVSIEDELGRSSSHALSPLRPNPFGSQAAVTLSLAQEQHVRVTAHDVLGREVAILHEGSLGHGEHTFVLPGENLPDGVYVVRATSDHFTMSRKAVLAR